ncbi:hypothetical protein BDV96DRAFT_684374 [Lophiotrema nucula]|uniref:Uncharacterized protein n=1 Tax=Lophiotrema nucula TaxID=690887 RepID=A0A6A5ZHZ8_9PLEO|nr:hypothetical protein BDV96DRAFT_684374 [Lophiotrema nucula]
MKLLALFPLLGVVAATIVGRRDEAGARVADINVAARQDTATIVPPMVPSDRPIPNPTASPGFPAMVPSDRPFPNPTASPVFPDVSSHPSLVFSTFTAQPLAEREIEGECGPGWTTDYRGTCRRESTTSSARSCTTDYRGTYRCRSNAEPTPVEAAVPADAVVTTSTSSTYTTRPSGQVTDYRGHCWPIFSIYTTTTDTSSLWISTLPHSAATPTAWTATIQTSVPISDSTTSAWTATIQTIIPTVFADEAGLPIPDTHTHNPPFCVGPLCWPRSPLAQSTFKTSVRPTSVFERDAAAEALCGKCKDVYYSCRNNCGSSQLGCLAACCGVAKGRAACCGCLPNCPRLGCMAAEEAEEGVILPDCQIKDHCNDRNIH